MKFIKLSLFLLVFVLNAEAGLLKIVTTAGVKKHFFDTSQIQDVTAVSSADFRLTAVAQPTTIHTIGTYTQNTIDFWGGNYSNWDYMLQTPADHPNARDWSINAPATFWLRLGDIVLDDDEPAFTADGTTNLGNASQNFTVPRDEATWGFPLEAGEEYPTVTFVAIRELPNTRVVMEGFEVSAWGKVNNTAAREASLAGVNLQGTITADNGTNTIVVGTGSFPLPWTPTFVYGVRTVTPRTVGYGFADATGARIQAAEEFGNVNPITQSSRERFDATFGTETFQIENQVNVKLRAVTAVKEIKLSPARFDEELENWLNGTLYKSAADTDGFHTIKEDE